ncbi:MAG: polymer-forming cytoskeletal protein [Muribaculum sp.]|nr:polymer-forming cytoskeletal protein [Muribaculum sp.]
MLDKKDKEIRISTIIGEGVSVEGDFTAPGSVRIDGCVDGNVTVGGTLIVGAGGEINGNISAESAMIGGDILGNLEVAKKTELTQTAKVLGDITTAVIVIDENAVFQGKCNMNQSVSDRKAKAKAAKAAKESKKSAKAALAEALREVKEAEDRELQENGEPSVISVGGGAEAKS